MKSLQIQYSKEIAKALGKIAVYLPGENIQVGDIITFPHGKTSFLSKKKPFGSFRKITNLKSLGIKFTPPAFSKTPDTYRYSSKNSVNFNINSDATASLGEKGLPKAEKHLKINFSSEGSLFFLGVDCDKKELDDLTAMENKINAGGKKMIWENSYLVTSVTVARKALIIQSQSQTSELVLKGDVEGIQTNTTKIGAKAKLQIAKQKGNLFVKDWSDDVTVFMDLVAFEEEVFKSDTRSRGETSFLDLEESRIRLKKIQIEEILND